jgi:hypothetical protein
MTNQVQLRQRGPYRLRKKLRRALQHLADGRPLPEAAALARMTAPSLRLALLKPHVQAFLGEDTRARQSRLLPKALSTFERVMDLRLRRCRRCAR